MAEGSTKLLAVLRSCEASEHGALRERSRVEGTLVEREEILIALRGHIAALERRILIHNGRGRMAALHGTELRQAASVAHFVLRLGRELNSMREELNEREAEVVRARERLTLANDELQSARIDKKRVETLIGNRELAKRTAKAQEDELAAEESILAKRGI